MATYYDEGQEFELPAMDMKLWEKIEAVDAAEPGRATFKAMHDFVKACLPDEYLEAKLGGKSLDKIDLNKLNVCAFAIRSAYNREVNDAKIDSISDMMAQLKETAESMNTITEASNAMNARKRSRQGFKAVR